MPLFHDPERRRHYRQIDGHGEPGQQATGSSRHQPAEDIRTGLDGPEQISGSRGLSSSDLYPTKPWVNDRHELIQRIKESSPWRLQYSVSQAADGTHRLFP